MPLRSRAAGRHRRSPASGAIKHPLWPHGSDRRRPTRGTPRPWLATILDLSSAIWGLVIGMRGGAPFTPFRLCFAVVSVVVGQCAFGFITRNMGGGARLWLLIAVVVVLVVLPQLKERWRPWHDGTKGQGGLTSCSLTSPIPTTETSQAHRPVSPGVRNFLWVGLGRRQDGQAGGLPLSGGTTRKG